MVKRKSFYERREENYYKNMNFARREKFMLRIFWIKETLILRISGSKKRSFLTQEIGRKIFPYYLRSLSDS